MRTSHGATNPMAFDVPSKTVNLEYGPSRIGPEMTEKQSSFYSASKRDQNDGCANFYANSNNAVLTESNIALLPIIYCQ
jgi:hypothetical protein